MYVCIAIVMRMYYVYTMFILCYIIFMFYYIYIILLLYICYISVKYIGI